MSAEIIDDVASTLPHYDDLEANAAAVTMTNTGYDYTITGDTDDLATFASTDINKGSHAWLGIDIDTTVPDITNVSINGTPCTASQATLAAKYSLEPGHVLVWLALDDLADATDGITFTFATENNPNVTFKFVWEEEADETPADPPADAET